MPGQGLVSPATVVINNNYVAKKKTVSPRNNSSGFNN